MELLLDVTQFHQFVHDGIDGQATGTMDLQLTGDIPPVCDDRMGREEEAVGNLPIGHALHHTNHDLLFTLAQQLLSLLALDTFRIRLLRQALQLTGNLLRRIIKAQPLIIHLQGLRIDRGGL